MIHTISALYIVVDLLNIYSFRLCIILYKLRRRVFFFVFTIEYNINFEYIYYVFYFADLSYYPFSYVLLLYCICIKTIYCKMYMYY